MFYNLRACANNILCVLPECSKGLTIHIEFSCVLGFGIPQGFPNKILHLLLNIVFWLS